ncbi:MerR family transcriptional regulator [Bacillus sp. FJAT-49711]|uniref:MerR family transcriptional regulator n=1 Tax=Bacillus sp. FJAT-49711 TaxID=2833585 RepID=UPI001BC99C35|nr:MerR family transcriptional regulator [Bacillus sp. FJAT-49711]MBS4219664.1 MerR family transcriptional regulator [Bacillus sp. FJAT-49711]
MTYSIGEFAEIVGVTASKIRYYEKEGLLCPHRNEKNVRKFTDHDVGWFRFLLLLKDTGMSMEELKKYTEWRAMGEATITERLALLKKRRRLMELEMQALQKNMDILNRKVTFYEDQIKGNKYDFVLYPNEERKS